MRQWGNQFFLNTFQEAKHCDFDRDGWQDRFMATGITWWYQSSLLGGRWVYLNTATKRVADVDLYDATGDGRCDVTVDGNTYPTIATDVGKQMPRIPNLTYMNKAQALQALGLVGLTAGSINYSMDTTCEYLGLVKAQSPSPGYLATPNTAVNLYIGLKPSGKRVCNYRFGLEKF